jgi:hypothetical protein
MGKDNNMGLYKKRYVKNWEHTPEERKHEVTVKQNGKVIEDDMPVAYITYDAGYWRKANAIHKWFVDNCAGGDDDCSTMYVSRDKLEELLKTVNIVLAGTKLVEGRVHNGTRYENGKRTEIWEDGKVIEDTTLAEKYLPTAEGFFFGSTDYNEWYVQDLEETRDILTKALENSDDNCGFEYRASW